MVAAYAFDEGSGTSVSDSSGNGNTGTVSGATWVSSGKFGKALSFNGSSALVSVPDAASLHFGSAVTLEAWVDPSAVSAAWRDVIYKGSDAVYLESSSTGTGNAPAGGGTFGGQDEFAGGSSALAANTWSYLAETYDGSTIRLYVNGTQVGSLAASGAVLSSTSPLQIGGDSLFGQYFSGLIDDVRVYNVALSPAQVQSDMTTPVGSSDTQPPTAPGTLTATAGAAGQITLNWTASTDNTGVTGYLVERCQGAGCTNFAQIATPTATALTDTGLAAGASYSYRVRATDAAGNLSPYSNTATAFTGLWVTPAKLRDHARPDRAVHGRRSFGGGHWSVDGVAGGSTSAGTISSSGLYTASGTLGPHVITATSGGNTANATAYITNYAGTFTFHNDNMRDGANLNETVLTPSNVNSANFGKLFSYPLDGLSFASPLYVENVTIPGQGVHNVVYVATENDSVYAFDADGRSSTPLWKDSFINPSAGINPIPPADTGETGDIPNEIGITGTPVIDPTTNTLYVVAATKEVTGGVTSYVNRLHALDLSTGAEKLGGPIQITATVKGTGIDAVNGTITFNNITENQRPALTLANGELYIGFANHGNNEPYHGWLMAYNPTTLHQDWVFCSTPNAEAGGIWMGGDGPAVDSSGSIYFSTGNGTYDGPTGSSDYGDTLLRLNPNGTVGDYFTPYNYATLEADDIDLASGGILLLPDQPGAHTHEVIAGGKGGTLYLVDRDNMGHVGTTSDGPDRPVADQRLPDRRLIQHRQLQRPRLLQRQLSTMRLSTGP